MLKRLGLHETLELHELIIFKSTCLTKSAAMSPLAKDEDLKSILSEDAAKSKEQLQELQSFVSQH
ncbi:hypothetical protein JOC77_003869 [Peribacillus deserti]|uniref:Spore coat protein n=1 Tax=Peribacillus deserti TaxID=673318 RepID=A0ABS2QMM0_9BACI|nr:hypothetical protein [Peribacillus deserti]MBM7694408.1 hypothetical protein [Peribacillus deserti]